LKSLKLDEARQKAKREKKVFDEEWTEIQKKIEETRWKRIKQEIEEYKDSGKGLSKIISEVQRQITSPGGSAKKSPNGLPELKMDENPMQSTGKPMGNKSKFAQYHKVETLEDLEREEEFERKNLREKTQELHKIEENIAKLKKETNIQDIKEIGESYQMYVEKNASLAKEVKVLDEEVFLWLQK